MINRLIDHPLSLNKISLTLLFASHVTNLSPPFIRANIEDSDKSELYFFLKNYFEYGLPIFSQDLLDEDLQITYKNNPLIWLSKFEDTQIELVLSYIYIQKYVEHYFMRHWLIHSGADELVQRTMEEYENQSIINIKTNIHKEVLKLEKEFKEDMPDINFEYNYQLYLDTMDLNILFNLCYSLFFNGVSPSHKENLYNKQKISNFIE